jgi:hypothetical protein
MGWTVKQFISFNSTSQEYYAWYYLKAALKSAGWSVSITGNGTNNALLNSDIITNLSIMSNNNAYYVLKSPTVGSYARQIYVNRDGVNGSASLYYSLSGAYNGASVTAASMPGTDPYGGQLVDTGGFVNDGYSVISCVIVVGDYYEDYSWYMLCYSVIGGIPIATGMLAYDKLSDVGSSDVDPYVFLVWKNSHLTLNNLSNTTNIFTKSWTVPGLAAQNFGTGNKLAIYRTNESGLLSINNVGLSPDGFCDLYPIFYINIGAGSTAKGIKGKSKFKLSGSSESFGGTVVSSSSSKDTLLIGNMALPWVGTDFIGTYT